MKFNQKYSVLGTSTDPDIVSELQGFEKLIIALFVLLILSILIISGWSAALLALGLEDGGGPIGAMVSFLS